MESNNDSTRRSEDSLHGACSAPQATDEAQLVKTTSTPPGLHSTTGFTSTRDKSQGTSPIAMNHPPSDSAGVAAGKTGPAAATRLATQSGSALVQDQLVLAPEEVEVTPEQQPSRKRARTIEQIHSLPSVEQSSVLDTNDTQSLQEKGTAIAPATARGLSSIDLLPQDTASLVRRDATRKHPRRVLERCASTVEANVLPVPANIQQHAPHGVKDLAIIQVHPEEDDSSTSEVCLSPRTAHAQAQSFETSNVCSCIERHILLSCSVCNEEETCESKKKRPFKSLDSSSEECKRLLSVRLPPVSAPSGSGGRKVEEPEHVLLSKLVEEGGVRGNIVACSLCMTMAEKIIGLSRRTAADVYSAVARFYRRRTRPQKPTSCYYCDNISLISSRPDLETGSRDVGFEFRFTDLDPSSSKFRSLCEAIAFRVGLSVQAVSHFLRNTTKFCLCNKHRQDNRHAKNHVRNPSSRCAIPDCGAVANLETLRAPPGEDCSSLEDSLAAAFGNSVQLVDVIDRKLCPEHMALVTRPHSSAQSHDTLQAFLTKMQAFRGKRFVSFVIEVLRVFKIVLPETQTTSVMPNVASSFPIPMHGVLYFRRLHEHFQNFLPDEKSTAANTMGRRKLRHDLSTALAPFGIHTDKDPRNGFIYFFRKQLLIEEVRTHNSATSAVARGVYRNIKFVPDLHSNDERAELQRLSIIFKTMRPKILEGRFCIRELVTSVSTSYWVFQTWTLASERQRSTWVRSCSAKQYQDPSFIWPCGNREQDLPSGDILHTLLPSSVDLVRKVLTEIERRVAILTGVAGPIGISLGALVNMKGTKSLQTALSRLGLCCSYAEILKVRSFYANRRLAAPSKVFSGIPPNYLVCMSLDNADFALPNTINVTGKNTNGEHFTFASVHGMMLSEPPPEPEVTQQPTLEHGPASTAFRDPRREFPTREDLVSFFTTTPDDPDITSYTVVLLGRVWQLRDRLQSTNPQDQLSLRHLLFSSMEVFPAQNSVVIFAKLEDFKASDANELIRMIDEAVLEMLPGEPGRYELLGVSGDFPVLWIIWKEWTRRLDMARKESKELKWFPFPSGAAFHDLKVGALPTMKKLMEGALVEDLIKDNRAGLSKWYSENWHLVGNLRKNRRVNDSVIVASILSIVPTLRSDDPELEAALEKQYVEEPQVVQKAICETGSDLKVSKAVTRKAYEDGLAIYKSMKRFAQKYRNAEFYLGLILLDLMIPTTALQVLSRCGQTGIYQKFYFNLSPYIMQTTKLSYQKHSVMTMHILAVLPPSVVADIFGGNPGALVVNPGKNPFANLPQDETLETGVGTVKKLPIRRKEPLLKSVTWCGELSRMANTLLRALDLEGKSCASFKSKEELRWDGDGVLVIYDKERGGASNVAEFLKLCRAKGQFSAHNLTKQYLCNVLGDSIVEIRTEARIVELLTMKVSGKKKLEVLVSRIIPEYMEFRWRPEDLALLGLKVQPRKVGAWTKAGAVKPMADSRKAANESSLAKSSTSPSELDGEKTWISFSKKWNSRVSFLLTAVSNNDNKYNAAMVSTAQALLVELNRIGHISSSLALAYRSENLSVKPGHGFECRQRKAVKSAFFRNIQSEAKCLLPERVPPSAEDHSDVGLQFLSESGAHPKLYDIVQIDVENVGHFSLQKTARSGTIGAVMEEQMTNQLRPLLAADRSKRLKHIHLHCDVAKDTVEQKTGTQIARDERNDGSDRRRELRDFCEEVVSAQIHRSEKEGFTSGYLFYGALAALKLEADVKASADSSPSSGEINVYLHGGSFAISNEAMGVSLDLLDILKCPETCNARVLIYRKDRERPQVVADSFPPGVTVYERSACFCITASLGIYVCSFGSSSHGEGETRFIFAFRAISKPLLDRQADSQCLIVSNDSDCPAISLACSEVTGGQNFVHKVSSQFIYIDHLLNLLSVLGVSPASVPGCFALGGCDFCPGTAGVSQGDYLRALLARADLMGGWQNLARKPTMEGGVVASDIEAVVLTGLAFALKYQSFVALNDQAPTFLRSRFGPHGTLDKSLWNEIECWLVRVRKSIARKPNIMSASLCLPETDDIILQGRRASFVLWYWQGSDRKQWGRHEIGCVQEEWGYCRDSSGDCWPLYEREESVKARKLRTAFPFTRCGCVECKTMSCSCRKAGLVCIAGLCKKCESACTNTTSIQGVGNVSHENSTSQNPHEDLELCTEFVDVITVEDSEDDEAMVMPESVHGDNIFDCDSSSESGYETS